MLSFPSWNFQAIVVGFLKFVFEIPHPISPKLETHLLAIEISESSLNFHLCIPSIDSKKYRGIQIKTHHEVGHFKRHIMNKKNDNGPSSHFPITKTFLSLELSLSSFSCLQVFPLNPIGAWWPT